MPYEYRDSEYADMVMSYWASGAVLRDAREFYQVLHPGQRTPSQRTILTAVQRLRDFGQFRVPNVDAGRPRRIIALEENILSFFDENPRASTNDAARTFGVSQWYAWRVVSCDDGRHPYHFTRVQQLLPRDFEPRVTFCRWLLEDPNRNILWTDESTFTRIGLFNQHNAHWWATTNPHRFAEDHFQHRFSVNVWAGLINGVVLGPVFLRSLNGETYLRLLRRKVQRMLDREVPLASFSGMFYMHDGAPAHNAREVRDYMSRTYGQRWIGRNGPVPWPARSPDLTPMDFFLWGHVKQLVYDGDAPESARELKSRIRNAFRQVRLNTTELRNVRQGTYVRARQCLAAAGGHFQQLH